MRDRVLIVDDEPRIRDGLKRALRKEQYEIVSAASAEDALAILERQLIDVVVSDEQMPGMCGSEFLGVVARDYPETIRIILSGHASLEAAVRAINEGRIYRFLLKPCNDVDLAITIRQALEQKALVAKNRELLRTVRRQHRLLQDLEKDHPGITQVRRSAAGEVVIDEESDPEAVLSEMSARGRDVTPSAPDSEAS